MKRYIRSDSPYYTTRRAQLPVIDTEAADYYPISSRKHTKRMPGKEKSNAYKNLLQDEFDVLDSYTADIDIVYSELNAYQDSIVQPIAEYIQRSLEYYANNDRYLVSDELQEIDALLVSASNLEVLEDACLQFEELAGCKLNIFTVGTGPVIKVRYETFIGTIMDPRQVWTVLSGEHSASYIADSVMMTKHKANIKKYGAPTELL